MAIATWNCITPQASQLNELRPEGDFIRMAHTLGTAAPVVGSWIGLMPRKFSGYGCESLKITIPYLDSGGALRWQIGVFDAAGQAMRGGDSSLFAATEFRVTGSNVAQQTLYNGQSATGISAGVTNGDDTTLEIVWHDLEKYTPPFDRLSNGPSSGDYTIALVCTAAPTGWLPTDAAPKQIRVGMRLYRRPLNP